MFTAYEYLERRLDANTRSLTAFLFLMSRGMSCGTIIADKAIVCYKCGTPTMEAPARVNRAAPNRRFLLWVVIAVVIAGVIVGKILWP